MLISQPQIGLFTSFKKEKLSAQSLVLESGIVLYIKALGTYDIF